MVQTQTMTEADWRLWRELRLRALSDAPNAFGSTYDEWVNASEARWRQRLRAEGLHLVAADGGVPCGMASGILGEGEGKTELVSVWVDPAMRGRGVLDVLIERIASWATSRADELRLTVVPGNSRAIAAYRRNGFDIVQDERGDVLPDGSGHELVMARRLSRS